jgi:AraC-like DNA-binding protein
MVKEMADQLGYPDALYFSRAFHRYHGIWPTEAKSAQIPPADTEIANPTN